MVGLSDFDEGVYAGNILDQPGGVGWGGFGDERLDTLGVAINQVPIQHELQHVRDGLQSSALLIVMRPPGASHQ